MENQRFDIAYIRKYVNGELSPRDMHALELASQEDEMLMDLILGVEAEKAAGLTFNKQELNKRIIERTSARKVQPLFSIKALGAAAALLLVAGLGYYTLRDKAAIPTAEHIVSSSETAAPEGATTDSVIQNEKLPASASNKLDDTRIASVSEPKIRSRGATQNRTRTEANKSNNQAVTNAPPTKLDNVPLEDTQVASAYTTKEQDFTNFNSTPDKSNANVANTRPQLKHSTANDTMNLRHFAYSNNQVVYNSKRIAPQNSKLLQLKADAPDSNHQNNIDSSQHQSLAGLTTLDHPRLDTSSEELQEVTVVIKKTKKTKRSKPLGGWKNYKSYLKKATREVNVSPGMVVLLFDINDTGELTNIRVVEAASDLLIQPAISIVKQGPLWLKGRSYQNIKLKINFDN